MTDIALLILRFVLGLTFLGHGSQKLFGWFGGAGLKGTIAMMGQLGMRPSWLWGGMAALTEFGGGLLVLLGFLSPVGSLGIISSMLVAIVYVHWKNGFWNMKGGLEYPLIIMTAALAIAITGMGKYSLDAFLGIALPEPLALLVGLVLVILGVIGVQVGRTPAPAPGK